MALGPPSLLFSAHLGSFPGENSEGVKLITDFHLVQRLRVSEATPLLTLHLHSLDRDNSTFYITVLQFI